MFNVEENTLQTVAKQQRRIVATGLLRPLYELAPTGKLQFFWSVGNHRRLNAFDLTTVFRGHGLNVQQPACIFTHGAVYTGSAHLARRTMAAN